MNKAAEDPFDDFGPQEIKPEGGQPLTRDPEQQEHFPVHALGGVLGNTARAIEDRVQCPIAVAGQSVLATATLAVQGHADMRLPVDGQEKRRPVSNHYVTIAAPSERKTTADAIALVPVRWREQELREIYKVSLPSYCNAKENWEAERAKLKQKIKDMAERRNALDALGPVPEPPLQPLLTYGDVTFQGLARGLITGQPSAGLFLSEGGIFLGGFGMRDENVLLTCASLNQMWDGVELTIVRADRDPVILAGRRLCGHLMIQSGIAPRLFRHPVLNGIGLTSRILAAAPPSTIGQRCARRAEAPTTAPALATYSSHLLDILERPLPLVLGTRNELKPRVLTFDRAAGKAWREFADHIEVRCAPGGEYEDVLALAGKAPEHAARLAGVRTLVDDIEAAEISEDRLRDGIELAQYYLSEALRLRSDLETEPDLKDAQKLLDWIRPSSVMARTEKHSGERLIALVDVYQKGPRAFRSKEAAMRAIGVLEDHKWLTRVPGCKVNGEMRTDVWRLKK